MEEEIQIMALCIEEEQEKKNKVKAEVEMINNVKDSKRIKVSAQRATPSHASECYKRLISSFCFCLTRYGQRPNSCV